MIPYDLSLRTLSLLYFERINFFRTGSRFFNQNFATGIQLLSQNAFYIIALELVWYMMISNRW